MAYLGPPPSQKLATPTSQYFSGNGSTTAFTLNRPVNVAEDLNVYVNNVAQEPGSGKSYTATGTTLTFDAAPSSGTNNVYVVYRGLSEGTLRLEGTTTGIDDNADSTAITIDSSENVGIGTTPESFAKLEVKTSTDKNIAIFDNAAGPTIGAITDAGSSTSLRIAGFPLIMTGNGGSGAEALRIDSSGRTTIPNQPSCLVRMSNVSGIDATGQIALGNGYWQALSGGAFDNGSNFSTSTGRFTAPVTGYYHFTHHMRVDAANGSYLYTSILENSNDLVSRDLRSISTSYQTLHNSGNAYLAANDYLYVQFHVVGDSSVNIDSDSFFSCFLIG